MLLVSLAHHFLVRLRILFQDQAPALTVYQVRLLLASVLPKPTFDIPAALNRVQYYRNADPMGLGWLAQTYTFGHPRT